MSKKYEDKILDYLKNYMSVEQTVKEILSRIDLGVRVFLFGSVVRGKYTALSDIDVLVVTEKIGEKHMMVMEVYRSVEAPVPLHVTTPEKFADWYLRFIPEDEIVEV